MIVSFTFDSPAPATKANRHAPNYNQHSRYHDCKNFARFISLLASLDACQLKHGGTVEQMVHLVTHGAPHPGDPGALGVGA